MKIYPNQLNPGDIIMMGTTERVPGTFRHRQAPRATRVIASIYDVDGPEVDRTATDGYDLRCQDRDGWCDLHLDHRELRVVRPRS